jgi:2-polyprenyl-6-methoxyphenol hydroxylase-like FAD-dependent oxidoreductase
MIRAGRVGDPVDPGGASCGEARALVLGDAAQAMTPNQGRGAAMAIADARALALALRPGTDGALRRYVAMRGRRVRRVQLTGTEVC